MKKLWDKGYRLDTEAESFTVGEDALYDKKLIFHDCLGSVAHSAMLKKIGVLSLQEFKCLHIGLWRIIDLAKEGKFSISVSDEDVHTAVENYLTLQHGDAGKKLHTARSRNDQIALDTRLYMKEKLLSIASSLLDLCQAMSDFSEEHNQTAIPGRTHMQTAMPSSFGLWAGAFLEALLDDFFVMEQTYRLIDQCPLGAAASYGTALPIDRRYTADLLGFSKVQNNVLYANNSRGKLEGAVVHAMAQTMTDLSRMASDLILYSIPEFAYVALPKEYCSGSSLMPQKHNPCVLELIRAKAATVLGYLPTLFEIARPLPSGYSRDLQETKAPFMKAMETTHMSLSIMARMVRGLKVDKEKCLSSFSREIFATDVALQLVEKGMPFREAYRKVASETSKVEMQDPVENILSKTHLGSTGNLGISISNAKIQEFTQWFLQERKKWEIVVSRLGNLEELIK